MFVCARGVRAGAGWAGAGMVVGLAGCWPTDAENGGSLPELVLSAEAFRPPASALYYESEPNDEFNLANLVSVDESVELAGSLGAQPDVLDQDVYELGPASAGDRIVAGFTGSSNGVRLGILDDRYRLLAFVDPSNRVTGPSQPDFILHESTSRLYVAAAATSSSSSERPYTAWVRLEPGIGLPDYRPQILVLDFQGGEGIRIGGRAPIDIPPFDAANIGSEFAGYTEWIINRIMEMVAEDYAGLDVQIYRAGDPDIPEGDRSVVYFGTYDNQLLGLADNIDPYNAMPAQAAVLYTDTFGLFHVLSPSVEEISQILANVTSHEAGHLLGLRHTANVRSLMDVTATARQMMLDQWFCTADLHESVMPLGVQDAPALLAWTLGGTPPKPPASRAATLRRAAEVANDPNDFYVPRHQLATCFCSECVEGGQDGPSAELQ